MTKNEFLNTPSNTYTHTHTHTHTHVELVVNQCNYNDNI